MNKQEAIELINKNGLRIIGKNITFSNENNGKAVWWINPSIELIKQDWYLILFNSRNNKLYVFKIPANSISKPPFRVREEEGRRKKEDV